MANIDKLNNDDLIIIDYLSLRMIADAMNYAEEHGDDAVKTYVHQKRVALIAALKKRKIVDNKILAILV